jgi:sulfonate transport system ATP-binding protein
MTALLEVQVRQKNYGPRRILQDVNLELAQGSVTALVGASGCGKSTLLRLIAGLDRDFAGSIKLDGSVLNGAVPDIRFIFQEPRLFPWLTVADNVAFDVGGAGHDRGLVEQLLREVGLEGYGHYLPRQLSGGQAQRVAIARGLYVQPRLLLLDEPFSAVDAFTRIKLQDLLLRVVQDHGIATVLVTHDVEEAVVLADRVIVIEADPGRISANIEIDVPRPRSRDVSQLARPIGAVRQALSEAHVF